MDPRKSINANFKYVISALDKRVYLMITEG